MATNTAQIPVSVSPQLYAQITNRLDRKEYRAAIEAFLSAPRPTNPITREVLIRLRDERVYPKRTLEITANVPKPTQEELKSCATEEGVTVSAIVRRALYEYTKPESPDLVVMYDAWGDAKKA